MARGDATVAQNIDEVLAALDGIIARAIETENRLGYFAALYRKVTAKVKEGIEQGFFEDPARMERLDVIFANRFLGALDHWQRDQPVTRSWELAFEASSAWRPTILQHLLLGMNAPINLDLGIAAAAVAPGPEFPPLRDDFDRINEILFSLVDAVIEEIGEVSPWIALLARLGGRAGDEIIRFSLGVARDEAWHFGAELAPLPATTWGSLIELRDRETELVGGAVLHPGWWLGAGLTVIRLRESSDVAKVIRVLSATSEPSLSEVETRCLRRPAKPR